MVLNEHEILFSYFVSRCFCWAFHLLGNCTLTSLLSRNVFHRCSSCFVSARLVISLVLHHKIGKYLKSTMEKMILCKIV